MTYASTLHSSISDLGAVALGEKKADLIIQNAQLLSVYTKEIIPDTQIAISSDRIAYVGSDASHTKGSNTKIIDADNRLVGPGLADPHTHIDQFVLPSEFAHHALLCGTTSLFSDPIDMVSVAGANGFAEFLKMCRGLPIRIFQMIPGGLPVDPMFSSSGSISKQQAISIINKEPDVLGLGEVFSWTKVTQRDPTTMKLISAMLERGCTINGHTAGARGKKLEAYVSSGISSCHEPTAYDEVLERLRLGMWVMIREGSIRRDLSSIIHGVLSNDTDINRLMFCSDGLTPPDIVKNGCIDHCVRQAVSAGLSLIDAITMASLNVFEYYNMSKDLGGIAPGRLADIVVYSSVDPDKLIIKDVFVGGRLVLSSRKLVVPIHHTSIAPWIKRTIKARRLLPTDIQIKVKKSAINNKTVPVNTVLMKTEIITGIHHAELPVDTSGIVHPSMEQDIWKVAAIERTNGTNKRTVGFLEKFGSEIGAFASTWSFHENDMIIIGSNDSDMILAANHLISNQGGMVTIKDGKVSAFMSLPIAGIISADPFEKVLCDFQAVGASLADTGCIFDKPHLIPLFLPFLALPSYRVTSGGIIDVKNQEQIYPLA